MKAAVLGPEGSFSHKCLQTYSPEDVPIFREPLGRVLEAVKHREADYGLVPFENSNSGSIKELQTELFQPSVGLTVIDLTYRHIALNLFSFEQSLANIVEVRSKDVVLMQSQTWLKENLPQAVLTPVLSTSAAVKMLSEEKMSGGAAIADLSAGSIYHVPCIANDIQDEPNLTLFVKVVKSCELTASTSKFALIGIPDYADTQLEKLLGVLKSIGADITHNWVLDDMTEVPNTSLFEIRFASGIEGTAFIDSLIESFPSVIIAGLYSCQGLADFSILKHHPYAPPGFDY